MDAIISFRIDKDKGVIGMDMVDFCKLGQQIYKEMISLSPLADNRNGKIKSSWL